jgi:hypothetical protein
LPEPERPVRMTMMGFNLLAEIIHKLDGR